MPSEKSRKKLPSVKILTQANTSSEIVLMSDMKLFKGGFDWSAAFKVLALSHNFLEFNYKN